MIARRKVVAGLACLGGTALVAAPPPVQASTVTRFAQVNLVSDVPHLAQLTDPKLVNPWGLASGPATPIWVADADSNSSTVYSTHGRKVAKLPLNVSVPGGPTGQVFNDTVRFKAKGMPATYIFDTESGDVRVWNTKTGAKTAKVASHKGASYKGLALLHTKHGPLLLAADFAHGAVDAYDSRFKRVKLPKHTFKDSTLPKGYAPFNVTAIGGSVYVAYALKNGEDEQAGAGLGFVDVYTHRGSVRHRVASHGALNAPWAIVKAPSSFGTFAGTILVGNFGDGHINAYDRWGHFRGALPGKDGKPLAIEGLWGLKQGNPVAGGSSNLWFAAGINDEAHGLLGLLKPIK